MNNSDMPDLTDKVGQLFMIGIRSEILSDEEKEFINSYNIGFIILFSRNISSAEQLKKLTSSIHRAGETPPMIFIDQEGGPIVRLGEMGSTLISHMGLAATGKIKNARKAGQIIGEELNILGIDGVFAPVLDVNTTGDNPVIGIRAFSDDPLIVAKFGSAFFKGLKKSRIVACGKHFPGHGHTFKDSHLEIPESNIDMKFLSEVNLPPFQKLINAGIDSIMTAHVLFPAISKEIATFSPCITKDILRNDLGFSGVLFSDCLEMDAVKKNYSSEQIIEKVIDTSLDVVSVSHSIVLQKELVELFRKKINDNKKYRDRVDESLQRIEKLKKKIKTVKDANVPVLRRNRKKEKKIAIESITLLKNDLNIVPIRKKGTLLVLDMKKNIHTANLSGEKIRSETEKIFGDLFRRIKYIQIKKDSESLNEHTDKIVGSDYVLLLNHSINGNMNVKELSLTEHILELRKDLILVFAGSPYPVKKFKNAGTIILTYGSRNVQLEALISILSGEAKPKGILPVSISRQFPFGSYA